VESNNGRRLGAGSYRTGVYLGGADSGFTYTVAVTNSERDEFSSLNGNSDPGVQGSGTAANNTPSLWGNVGYGDKFQAAPTSLAPPPAICRTRVVQEPWWARATASPSTTLTAS